MLLVVLPLLIAGMWQAALYCRDDYLNASVMPLVMPNQQLMCESLEMYIAKLKLSNLLHTYEQKLFLGLTAETAGELWPMRLYMAVS